MRSWFPARTAGLHSMAWRNCGFDSLDDLRQAISDPCYLSEIHPDELKFLDFPNCVILLVEEVSMS
jgi:hypothetical protein